MEENTRFTKGDREYVISRMHQVHTITSYCPLLDEGTVILKQYLIDYLPNFRSDENLWSCVPVLDALNIFIHVAAQCEIEQKRMGVIAIIAASFKSFEHLKYINFDFTDDIMIYAKYNNMIEGIIGNKIDVDKEIYKIELVEFNLTDMFKEEIVDALNRVFIIDGIIENSVLNRVFNIDFDFDNYISFIDMFISNNDVNLNLMDTDICDYLRYIPSVMELHKPVIRIITNYKEM